MSAVRLVLHRAPVDLQRDLERPSGRRRARPGRVRPGRQERRRVLAGQPVQPEAARVGADQRVAGRDVVADRVAGDDVERPLARHAARAAGRSPRRARAPSRAASESHGQHDVVVRADHRVGEPMNTNGSPGARALVELRAGAVAVGGGRGRRTSRRAARRRPSGRARAGGSSRPRRNTCPSGCERRQRAEVVERVLGVPRGARRSASAWSARQAASQSSTRERSVTPSPRCGPRSTTRSPSTSPANGAAVGRARTSRGRSGLMRVMVHFGRAGPKLYPDPIEIWRQATVNNAFA